MKKLEILYISKSRYLSLHFLNGWKNCFLHLGYKFKHIQCDQVEQINEYLDENEVDYIFTYSNEGLKNLSYKKLNKKKIKLIVGALPFNKLNISFDVHCPLMDEDEIKILENVEEKLAWSQHEPEFNDFFYSGFLERSISIIYLPHCADITRKIEPIKQKELNFDLFYVGNIGHKKNNIQLLKNILSKTDKNRIKIIGDKYWYDKFNIETQEAKYNENWEKFYSQSLISLNFHSKRQKFHNLLINDRTFHIPIFGGFQICDNLLARKFFKDDELIIASNDRDYLDVYEYFRKNYEERHKYIVKGFNRVIKDHSYFNRWYSILDHFSEYNSKNDNNLKDNPKKKLNHSDIAFYYLESKLYNIAKKIKSWMKN